MKVSEKIGRVMDKTSSRGWYWKIKEDLFQKKKMEGPKDSENKISFLALGIFGLVLFPSMFGQISLEAAGVFVAMEKKRINMVATILAETILSLNYCKMNGVRFYEILCSVVVYICIAG
jgi:hypothetical protein